MLLHLHDRGRLFIHVIPINFPHALFQAGIIRTEQEEFFIEPVEKGGGVIEEEKEGGGGRTHIVYRSSAVKKAAVDRAAADDHSRGQSAGPAALPRLPPLHTLV